MDATSTTEESDETTTEEVTPTTESTTTTVTITAEEAEQVFASQFNERRVSLAESLEQDSDTDVESVDRFEYDPKTKFVILEVTSAYQTDEFVAGAAWAITRTVLHVRLRWSVAPRAALGCQRAPVHLFPRVHAAVG